MSSPLAEAFLMDSLNSCYETPSQNVALMPAVLFRLT